MCLMADARPDRRRVKLVALHPAPGACRHTSSTLSRHTGFLGGGVVVVVWFASVNEVPREQHIAHARTSQGPWERRERHSEPSRPNVQWSRKLCLRWIRKRVRGSHAIFRNGCPSSLKASRVCCQPRRRRKDSLMAGFPRTRRATMRR